MTAETDMSVSTTRAFPGLRRSSRKSTAVFVFSLALVFQSQLIASAEAQSTTWGVFSDVAFSAEHGTQKPATFGVGGVDLFIAARLSDRVRVLSENVLEILDDGVVFDLERIYLEYQIFDALSVRAGRMHTSLGYYTTAFHHAKLLQLGTQRPLLLRFEDDGGVLPAHTIGFMALGAFETSILGIGYNFAIANGRGQFADDVLSVFDRNGFKALSLRLRFEPLIIEGLELGVSAYLDRIPKGFTDTAGVLIVSEALDELILGAHAAYMRHGIRFILEGYRVNHTGRKSSTVTSLQGGFLQLGYEFSTMTPYLRVDYLDRTSTDPFLNASGAPVTEFEFVLGTAVGLADGALLKVEYTHGVEQKVHQLVVQAAFGIGGTISQ